MNRLGKVALRLAAASAWVVPTVAMAAPPDPPPLAAYGELPALESATLSPGGNLALLGQVQGKRMLLILDPRVKPLKALEIPSDMKVRGIDWAGDDTVLLEHSETIKLDTERFTSSKGEISNVLIIPLDSSRQVRTVFADERKMVKAVFGGPYIRSRDGKWFAYFGGEEMALQASGNYTYEGAPVGLYAIDVSTNRSERTASAPVRGIWRDWILDASGKIAATLDWKEGNHDWTIVNKAGKQIASGNQPKGDVGLVAFGQDGETVIYSEADESENTVWYEVPLDGSAPAKEFLREKSVDRVFTQPFTGRMIGYRPNDSDSAVVFFDPAQQATADGIFKAYANLNPRLEAWTPDFKEVLLSTNGNGDSGTWYLLDTVMKQSQLVGVERPQIGSRVGPISTIDYKAADGAELRGILTLPLDREAKNLPLVVFPHGGPHDKDIPRFDWWAQAFASRGYAVFQPNFRGSTDRDDEFRHASRGEWGRKMQTDISDGVAELANRGLVDPKRVCIMGASYGGYAALAGVTLQQGLYRCAVSVAGLSDLKMRYDTDLFQSNRNRFLKADLELEMGDPGSLGQISPRRFAARADAPILLIHGKDDTVVPFQQSSVMADALKDAGKPYEFVEMKGEDHWLSRSETRKQMLEAAVAFVQKYNPAD